jgi:hypothetical protein
MADKIGSRLENYVQSRPEEEVRLLQLREHLRTDVYGTKDLRLHNSLVRASPQRLYVNW